MLAFQIADIYQVQAFRGHEKQYFRLASAWSVVFLILIGVSFFAKAGDQFSRVWLGSFYVIGLLALLVFRRALFIAGAALDPGRPADAAHRHRRRRRSRRSAGPGDARSARFRRPRDRPVRRPRRRPLAAGDRRRAQARHRRRSGRVRAADPRRPRDLLAADHGRRPHPADAEEAVGAAGRHPALGAFQQAALPPPLLLLSRQRAGARRVRPADHRLGRGDEISVRQNRRRPCAHSARRR